MQFFSNKAAQFHAADLFDVQSYTLDLAKTVEGLAPYLMLNVCSTPPDNASEVGASVVTSPSTVGDILSPLLTKIGRLHCLVDNRVHLQQSAGMSVVGYNAFYTHKSSQNQGLKNYGHVRASTEFLAQDRKDTEAAVRNSKAHQKLLSSERKRQAKSSRVETAKSVGKDGNS